MSADERDQQYDEPLLESQLRASIDRAARYRGFHFALLAIDLLVDAEASPSPDALAAQAVRRLEATLRVRETPPTLRHNDLVVRIASRRFAVLLDGLKDLGHATVVAERMLTALRTPFALDGPGDMAVTARIGLAVSATGYTQPEDVCRDAVAAAGRARHAGAGYDVFDPPALAAAQAELRLEADFDGALDRGEFHLVYQPIVSLESNRILGFEALVRWQHPVLGLVAPLEFIPLAEQCGFIVPLGHWVLHEACRQLEAWRTARPDQADVWVSVNLSSLQLRRPAIVEEIAAVLRDTGLDARRLVLELTEGMAMENPAAVRTLLIQLRALGVRVSVDDFGTGHSSLSYLRQFPLDSLKVDRSFVRGIETSPELASIVSAVTSLARRLGLRVIAEGIEKDEQVGVLAALGCECGQGYLFSRPLDAAAAHALLDVGLSPRPACVPVQMPAVLPAVLPAFLAGGTPARRAWPVRWLIAAAAAVAVMLSIGLPRVKGVDAPGSLPSLPSSPSALEARRVDVALAAPVEAPPPAPRRAVPLASPPVAALRAAAAPVTTAAAAPPSRELVPNVVSSLRVAHQHRLGSCRGLLVVSRDGVSFVADRESDKDGFTLRYAQFVESFDGGSLTIKSNARDYRFKPAGENGRDDGQLEQLAAAISRIGQRSQR